MLNCEHIQQLIAGCRKLGLSGVVRKLNVLLQDINVDFVTQGEFLGSNGNPAIFVNEQTYKLLSKFHPTWKKNKTIVIREHDFHNPHIALITKIGMIVHELGHAFNVEANLPNSECNAYIFEVEALAHLYKNKKELLYGCEKKDLQDYFNARLPIYRKSIQKNNKDNKDIEYLETLVKKIEQDTLLEEKIAREKETQVLLKFSLLHRQRQKFHQDIANEQESFFMEKNLYLVAK
ncbi:MULTISPECIES: hypothetical protein [Legionella]|uniref:Uncharacterized protein n=1 Tax=Legionella septentrionalis TaxID=2498109 RepID=A0A433JIG5_9GAMM|nr:MULTISPECIES: hypothetical protein [Legionella]MCP0913352.1 hypothetical protein [Legionella sp. 27cVA30]RUQ85076.1 hypothetical protein EKM59_07575 [Legionella septentrionalis]RUQ95181.1 hypothetical protein ELY11_09705 [Legionella septentrionalis]RUR08632.1 hypothetical protein ELY14_10990 [Legionella septentrionalis]RUR14867.1 hypothetical protein ELY10_07300 [Legionella septentrionalis]